MRLRALVQLAYLPVAHAPALTKLFPVESSTNQSPFASGPISMSTSPSPFTSIARMPSVPPYHSASAPVIHAPSLTKPVPVERSTYQSPDASGPNTMSCSPSPFTSATKVRFVAPTQLAYAFVAQAPLSTKLVPVDSSTYQLPFASGPSTRSARPSPFTSMT